MVKQLDTYKQRKGRRREAGREGRGEEEREKALDLSLVIENEL